MIRDILRTLLPPFLYLSGILLMIWTVFKKAEWGLFLMVALIPLPNIWYKLYDFPLGKDYLDFLFLAILIGIFVNKSGLERSENTKVIFLVILVSYFALWNSSMRYSLPVPITTTNSLLKDWKNYAQMIFMYFLVLSIVKDEDQQKAFVVLMCVVVLFISIRSYRSYTGGESYVDDSRLAGPLWVVHLGANHFGSFIAYCWAAFLGLFLLDNDWKRKMLFLLTVLFGLHPIFFSYSRGAYVAAFAAIAFYGVVKKRSLLIVLGVLLVSWKLLLPPSVVDRIMMTYTDTGLESSAAVRLVLWEHAMNLFKQNPLFGVGFGAYGFTLPDGFHYTDTHNLYLKMMSEQGIIGFWLLILVFFGALRSGWRLLRTGRTQFQKGLGLGFLGCVVAMFCTNMFGDRWSYFEVGSYFWIFWGLVDSSILTSGRTQQLTQIAVTER